jgi:hypothetical protein
MKMLRSIANLSSSRLILGLLTAAAALAAGASSSFADITHRYSFTTDASDSVGTANGTLVGSVGGGPTVSGGALQLNNPNFSGTSASQNYLSLPASILPSSGSATIESWFTFTGSGFATEDWTFTNSASDTNPPGASSGQYLMHTISFYQPATPPGGANTGGSHIAQSLAGYGGGETDAYETTSGIGAGGGGYLDDGETFMSATVIDASAGTLSYYLYDITAGGVGGLQQTITGIPLSSFAFTNAYLGRSAFPGDPSTSGSIDEFRIYNDAQSLAAVTADELAGPNVVLPPPQPASLTLLAAGGLTLLNRRRRA